MGVPELPMSWYRHLVFVVVLEILTVRGDVLDAGQHGCQLTVAAVAGVATASEVVVIAVVAAVVVIAAVAVVSGADADSCLFFAASLFGFAAMQAIAEVLIVQTGALHVGQGYPDETAAATTGGKANCFVGSAVLIDAPMLLWLSVGLTLLQRWLKFVAAVVAAEIVELISDAELADSPADEDVGLLLQEESEMEAL
ncbi:hypothetical protein MLD38_033017 [Melastoma candidum]|uniref:Uncharacterized protein n=1 Tax=Melastoma candidum TaxID=119954 RepID=A0ACB9M5U6_9MYRT|nr:hypothetical protein MLD38_033017 [Melastoma candidum]